MEISLEDTCHPQKAQMMPPQPSPALGNVKILLGSNSPRRRELLSLILPQFEVAKMKDVEEKYPADLAPEDIPAYLSKLKAKAYKDDLGENILLITADTIVLLDGKVLGKPKNRADAIDMIHKLSGQTHTVITGVTLTAAGGKGSDTFSVATKVKFAVLTDEEIEMYVDRFSPLDKAGAYGIQEWLGAAAIEGIEGSFYNVMGLPLHALYVHLRDFYA